MKILLANLKMNLLTKAEVITYLDKMEVTKLNDVIFFPSSIHLELFKERGLKIGSQDISFQEKGAYTGDLSVWQLIDLGINYTIVGHSERRKYYNDNIYVNRKLKLALENNLTTVLCIGETLEERKSDLTITVLSGQLEEALQNIDVSLLKNLIIAYEPVWAIGTKEIIDNASLSEVLDFIKKHLFQQYKLDIKLLYGGSVDDVNIKELNKVNNLDGYLIGSTSLSIEKLKSIEEFIRQN